MSAAFGALPPGIDPELFAKAAAEWREHVRRHGHAQPSGERSFTSINGKGERVPISAETAYGHHLQYLEGFPEAQRAARDIFQARQAVDAAQEARAAAKAFMADRKAFLKTLGKSGAGRWTRQRDPRRRS